MGIWPLSPLESLGGFWTEVPSCYSQSSRCCTVCSKSTDRVGGSGFLLRGLTTDSFRPSPLPSFPLFFSPLSCWFKLNLNLSQLHFSKVLFYFRWSFFKKTCSKKVSLPSQSAKGGIVLAVLKGVWLRGGFPGSQEVGPGPSVKTKGLIAR